MHNPQYPAERETGQRARKALGALRTDRHLQRGIPSIKDGLLSAPAWMTVSPPGTPGKSSSRRTYGL